MTARFDELHSPAAASSIRALPELSPRQLFVPVTVLALSLTLLFTAQDALRRGPAGTGVPWGSSLVVNALDWCTWGLLVFAIVLIGRRYRLDDASHRAASIIVWVALAVGACITQSVAMGTVLHALHLVPGRPPAAPMPPLARFLPAWVAATMGINIIIFGMITAAIHAALYYGDARARQVREADLEARLARADLNVLRMQLQPHFFYNALNTISSLMVTDVPTAQRVIAALGDLMRSSIDHTATQEVPLRSELAFVDRYVEIQKARFRHRLTVESEVDAGVLDALVPSLVLQPLVENAIRHGIEPHAAGGRVWVRAVRRDGTLTLTVRDDGSAMAAATASPISRDETRTGVGLMNIEARLAQLYGSAHTFRAGRLPDGHFDVTITMPYHTSAG